MSEIVLTNDNFKQEVIDSKIPVLVDFWAPWCGPCQMMGPVISKLSEESDGKYKVGKVNIDEEEALAIEYSIMSIPVIKLFVNGRVVASSLGVTSLEKLKSMIEENI